jgi:hypothetical protein
VLAPEALVRIENVVIGLTVETPEGSRSAAVDLEALRRHCRPERVEDLLDDLIMLCSDVQDAREAAGRRNSTTLRVLR